MLVKKGSKTVISFHSLWISNSSKRSGHIWITLTLDLTELFHFPVLVMIQGNLRRQYTLRHIVLSLSAKLNFFDCGTVTTSDDKLREFSDDIRGFLLSQKFH